MPLWRALGVSVVAHLILLSPVVDEFNFLGAYTGKLPARIDASLVPRAVAQPKSILGSSSNSETFPLVSQKSTKTPVFGRNRPYTAAVSNRTSENPQGTARLQERQLDGSEVAAFRIALTRAMRQIRLPATLDEFPGERRELVLELRFVPANSSSEVRVQKTSGDPELDRQFTGWVKHALATLPPPAELGMAPYRIQLPIWIAAN